MYLVILNRKEMIKMNPKYERQLKKGVLEILVLKLISQKKMYGYQLIMEMKELSHDMFILREGTLYPILYRLEDDGLVKSEWSEAKGKEVSRKYYSITDEGRKNLDELKELWMVFSQTVSDMMEDKNHE